VVNIARIILSISTLHVQYTRISPVICIVHLFRASLLACMVISNSFALRGSSCKTNIYYRQYCVYRSAFIVNIRNILKIIVYLPLLISIWTHWVLHDQYYCQFRNTNNKYSSSKGPFSKHLTIVDTFKMHETLPNFEMAPGRHAVWTSPSPYNVTIWRMRKCTAKELNLGKGACLEG
jgi:hypothetical protein